MRIIKLVTISRISKEKGFERMLIFEKLLNQSGIEYIWDCYGDTTTAYAKMVVPRFTNVKFKGVTNKPKGIIHGYDYLVQLSDTEGFPYSIYEAMQQKIPVIATDFPSIHEMIKEGVNGYIIKKDLSNFDINKIINPPVITEFKEKSTEKDWIKFLDMARPRKNTTEQKITPTKLVPVDTPTGSVITRQQVKVMVIKKYFDKQQNDKLISEGKNFTVSADRAKELVDAKVAKVIDA